MSHLRGHRAKQHGRTEERKFACHRCGKAFIYAYQLRTHADTHGPDDEDNPAEEEDNEEVAAEEDPVAAAGTNWVQTLYQCGLCQKVFDSYGGLTGHCAQEHPAAASVPGGGTVTFVAGEDRGEDGRPALVREAAEASQTIFST